MDEELEQEDSSNKKKKRCTAPEVKPNTDGKFTMVKNGVGRRFHASVVLEMEKQGWVRA